MSNLKAVATGLFVIVCVSSGAAAQQLLAPAHGACRASVSPALGNSDLFLPKAVPLCGRSCYPSEGGTSPTLTGTGTTCDAAASDLNSQLTSYANTTCRNYSGFTDCNFAVHDTTSCLIIIGGEYEWQGYATFNCYDTNC